MMRQLVLDIRPDAPPGFDNFVTGANAALLVALRQTVIGAGHLYLWGPHGSGRSHLLRAAVAASIGAGRPASYLPVDARLDALPHTHGLLIALDDVDALSPAQQMTLFNAFNNARERHQTLLLSGPHPPLDLKLREDLRTRVGQCLIFELRPLDDLTRSEILTTLAARKGLRLSDEVVEFLLRYGRRDLPALVSVLDALDRASLEHKRPATLPLLRELMQRGLDI